MSPLRLLRCNRCGVPKSCHCIGRCEHETCMERQTIIRDDVAGQRQRQYGSKHRYNPLSLFKIIWPCIVTGSLWIKPTNALMYNLIGITHPHVSGSLSAHHQEFLAVHRLWYILCSCDDRWLPGVGWNSSILLLIASGHQSCIKCTKADVRLRTPDDGQKGCPKHVDA